MLKMIYTRGLKYICLSACSYHGIFTLLNKANKWQSERDILSFLPMLITFWNVSNTFSSSYVKPCCYIARSILELLVSQVHMFKFSGFTSWRWMMWQKLHKTYRVTIITQNLYSLEKRCHSHQYLNFEQFRTLPKLYLDWLKWNPDDNLWQVSVVGRWRRTPFWNSPPLRIPECFDFDHLLYLFFFSEDTVTNPVIWLVLYAVRICGKNWSSRSTKSTRRTGYLAFSRWSGCSATLLSYCAAMKSISGAKLPIYQKSLVAGRITRHLRLLRQLKCLTVSKPPRC